MFRLFSKTARQLSSSSAPKLSLDPVMRLDQMAGSSAELVGSLKKMRAQIEVAKQNPEYHQIKPANTTQLDNVLEEAERSQNSFSVYG